MATALHIRNPQALKNPELVELFRTAMAACHVAPFGFESVAEDVFNMIGDDSFWVVAAVEDGKFVGLSLGFFPTNNIVPYPTCFTFYVHPKHPAAKASLAEKTVALILERGYTSWLAMNGTGHSDRAWVKALSYKGLTHKFRGSVYTFGIN